MSADFCSLWRDFVDSPTDAAVRELVRPVLGPLVDHVEACEPCLERCAGAETATLFEALAALDESLSVEEEIVKGMLKASADDEASVARAVTDALLPSLPDSLGLSSLGPDVSPHSLFMALDGIRMFLKRSFRRRTSAALKTLAMRSEGVVLNGEVIVPTDVLAAEIRQYAGLSADSARNVVRWIPAAARVQPHLLPGVDAEARQNDGVWLKMVRWNRTSDNLFDRWKPVVAPVEAPKPNPPLHSEPAPAAAFGMKDGRRV